METKQITALFEEAGLGIELLADGSGADCPMCGTPDLVGFANAA